MEVAMVLAVLKLRYDKGGDLMQEMKQEY